MKAALLHGPGDVQIAQVSEPGLPGEGEITLRIEYAALCGTDASQFRRPTMIPLFHPHEHSGHSGPTIIGHEVVGRVVAVGPGVSTLSLGQRVVPGSAWWCGSCVQCLAGRPNICEHYHLAGIHRHGGMAELATYPAKMCLPVPEGCPPEVAVLGQPCAVALHALDRARVEGEHTLVLFGMGGIGSLLLAVLHAQGHPRTIFAVDQAPEALELAARLGATQVINGKDTDPVLAIHDATCGRGCPLVIEATGVPGVAKQALACVGRGGRLLQVGIPRYPVNLLLDRLAVEELEIIGTNGQISPFDLERALDLLATTDLAAQINSVIIPLDSLVEDGLIPLAEGRAPGKILVKIS